MATIVEGLKSLNAYPIPMQTILCIAEGRGLSPYDIMNDTVEYRLATADVYMWLSNAPDVSQGGQSFSFTDEQRKHLRQRAQSIYGAEGVSKAAKHTIYGYKGTRL